LQYGAGWCLFIHVSSNKAAEERRNKMKNIGQQISVITYPKDGGNRSAFVQHHVNEARKAGLIVVYHGGFAAVHIAGK
jgi:hypothetical protein